MAAAKQEKELLSSVVGEIRSYAGSDPLRPWLRGIRKMEKALPPEMLREKLPRFLQKCAEEFQDDVRYRDDARYLRVWIQLMDYVKDAKPLLKMMEQKGIGLKRASFYMAYALYYEKHRRFESAEKMYRLGIQKGKSGGHINLSRCNSDDTVVVRFVGSALVGRSETEDACHHGLVEPTINTKEAMEAINSMFLEPLEPETILKRRSRHEKPNYNQQTSTFNIFVDEDEPNGNDPNNNRNNTMKQEHPKVSQQARGFEIFVDEDGPNSNNQNSGQIRNYEKDNVKLDQKSGGFEIFVDEREANGNVQNVMCHKSSRCPPRPLCDSSRQQGSSDFQKPFVGGFAILPDDEDEQCENMKLNQENGGFEIFVDEHEASGNIQNAMRHKNNMSRPRPLCDLSRQRGNSDFQKPFVGGFAILPDDEDEQCDINSSNVQPTHDKNAMLCAEQAALEAIYHESSHAVISGQREDTIIHRFVGSTVVGEPQVENACHHGLVDPTVNLKEAMNDINSMFGKPLNFKGDRANNRKNNALSDRKEAPASGFSILADDDLEEKATGKTNQSKSCKFDAENGLFEPTITTRDVMAEINDMFGMPLDF
ncbi:hypothetical protein PR202_ga04145 [Eleusine coracana subsp. coracana]|uniref:BUB1 N-terminal domain-containing protein n=1 Tax=Eleusine coracana subsp. coracana TaxID=191504 RepID=A0AAV5BR81_ELECO|nr:hypothetical protein PR202_ga04145 [Eleusine coracana subsp. coracana]